METKRVKDLMLSLDEYAVVPHDATLLEAAIALEKSQEKCIGKMQPHRAVLVLDEKGKVIGKLGHLAFLKALEPKYSKIGDLQILAKAGLTPEFMDTMAKNLRIWEDSLINLCKRARKIKVREVMHPASESIDENALLTEAIQRLIMWQTLSLLVTRGKEIVGILRLVDVYDEIASYMKKEESGRYPKAERE